MPARRVGGDDPGSYRERLVDRGFGPVPDALWQVVSRHLADVGPDTFQESHDAPFEFECLMSNGGKYYLLFSARGRPGFVTADFPGDPMAKQQAFTSRIADAMFRRAVR